MVSDSLWSFKNLQPPLCRLRLFAGIVRGAAFLWPHGQPAFLLTPVIACPGVGAVRRLEPRSSEVQGQRLMATFLDASNVLSCFSL